MLLDTKGAILYIHALTPLHPGAGTALGAVDLPVQRERHTSWPLVPSSSLKGVLRDAAPVDDRALLFGAEGNADELFAGALTFTDARIWAFPIRSLKGIFVWATCKHVLERWLRDTKLAGLEKSIPLPDVGEGEALVAENCVCVEGQHLYLEEFKLEAKQDIQRREWESVLPDISGFDLRRLTILSETDFSYFVQHATEVTARIKLDPVTKTVVDKALFYQEFLPSETLMYSLVLASPQRMKGESRKPASEVLDCFKPPQYLQLGGDETTGKGLCALYYEKKEG